MLSQRFGSRSVAARELEQYQNTSRSIERKTVHVAELMSRRSAPSELFFSTDRVYIGHDFFSKASIRGTGRDRARDCICRYVYSAGIITAHVPQQPSEPRIMQPHCRGRSTELVCTELFEHSHILKNAVLNHKSEEEIGGEGPAYNSLNGALPWEVNGRYDAPGDK